SGEDARRISSQIVKNPAKALDTLAREELGLNPDELGDPFRVASSSFICFALGALVPLLPFIGSKDGGSLAQSAGLGLVSLFGVGATLSLFTGRPALWSALRMVAIGA